MHKLFFTLALILGNLGLAGVAHAESIDEYLEGVEIPEYSHTEMGQIVDKSIQNRTVTINGTRYMVGNNNQTPVTLYGTTAGAFELLEPGMTVEVEYYDLGDKGRVALRITGLNPADVELY